MVPSWAQAQSRVYFPALHALGHPGARGLPPHPLSPVSDNDAGVQKDLLLTISNILLPNNYNSSWAIYIPDNVRVRSSGWSGACALFSPTLCPGVSSQGQAALDLDLA